MKVGVVQIAAVVKWDYEQRIHCCLWARKRIYLLLVNYEARDFQCSAANVNIHIYYYGQEVDLVVVVVAVVDDTSLLDIYASSVLPYLKVVDSQP